MSDTPTWLLRLERRLWGIRDDRMRIARFLEVFEQQSPSVAGAALAHLLVAGWRERDAPAKLLLDTAMSALGREVWPADHLEQVLIWAIRQGNEPVSAMIRRKEPREDEEPLPVPTYLATRPLTLGERKAIAAKPDRKLLAFALRDPHPEVIGKLLRNPKLTEADVLLIATKRPNIAAVLRRVAQHDKWRKRRAVAKALVYNPHTPPRQAISVIHLLSRKEVVELAADPRIDEDVRRFAAVLRDI